MLQPSLRDPVPSAIFPSRKRTAIDKERIFHVLQQEASMAENPPPSLKEVGLRLGYQPTPLYKINQAACHAIAERYTAHRRELREKRLQGYREEIRQIALYLQAEQMSLTQRHIGPYLAFGHRPLQTSWDTSLVVFRSVFQSRVRAQAASDGAVSCSCPDKQAVFQSRVRAQAASDTITGLITLAPSRVSIPRSGSGRFRRRSASSIRCMVIVYPSARSNMPDC